MPEAPQPAGSGRLRRFWQNLWGQDPDLHLETRWQKFMAFWGLHVPPTGRRDRLHIRPRFFKVIGVLGVGVPLLLLGAAFEFSTSPLLCNQCHIMKPYYQAWKTSKHSFVPCVDCHYPPGLRDTLWVKYQALSQVAKWATQTYSSKPFAEIEDASCLRSQCHATRLLEGKVTFKRGIIFDHRPHLTQPRRGRQLRCTSCHSQIVVGTHIEVTESTCFLCHFKGQKTARGLQPIGGCPLCHQPPQGQIQLVGGVTFNHKDFVDAQGTKCQKCHLDAVQGEGQAPRERCFTCHNQPDKLARYDDHEFLHEFHVARHNVDCLRCHTEITHRIQTKKEPMTVGCEGCHEAKHGGQRLMYLGVGGKDSPAIPSHMYTARVECVACHVTPTVADGQSRQFSGQTFTASEAACVSCHGKQYARMLDAWKRTFDTMLTDLKPKLEAARKAVGEPAKNAKALADARRLLAEAEFNAEFVEHGKGVHNPFYAADLLQKANASTNRVISLLGRSPITLPQENLIRGGYCATLCHAQAGVPFKPEVLFQKTTRVPHQRHFVQYAAVCTDCHSADKHKAVTITRDGCQACHHGATNDKCTTCHTAQAGLYGGTLETAQAVKKEPNVMAGKVECVGCHDLSRKHAAEAVAEKCTECHDKGYRDMLAMWQGQVGEALRAARAALEKGEAALSAAKREGRGMAAPAELLVKARKDVEMVVKAKGIHNPDLAEAIVTESKRNAERALALLTK
ncbi:MAG TPA: cytochrome c3 family protein [Candidatus Methylomirabilis sp.]|nr:cytochrome c3 family protein [Candidatus Methylomirabilis sp.]HSB81628.1 cytochrome c3 family protein [Candidatus Methylomirabilis sp.]